MRRAEKKKILGVLQNSSWSEVKEFILHGGVESEKLVHFLFMALCSTDQRCKWNGVSSFGVVVPRIRRKDTEAARIIMRRFLWSLNDESGGIGWGVPEAMAEVMCHDTLLFEEYVHMLLSYTREDGPEPFQDGNFLELPALQQGLLWGVGRLMECRKNRMMELGAEEEMYKYLDSRDKIVVGMALRCLSLCTPISRPELISTFSGDAFTFELYTGEEIRDVTIQQFAEKILHTASFSSPVS